MWEEGFTITGSFFSLFIKPKVANSLIQKRTVFMEVVWYQGRSFHVTSVTELLVSALQPKCL